jgi:hypothetical protein
MASSSLSCTTRSVKSSSRVSFMSAVTSEMTCSNCRSRFPVGVAGHSQCQQLY